MVDETESLIYTVYKNYVKWFMRKYALKFGTVPNEMNRYLDSIKSKLGPDEIP